MTDQILGRYLGYGIGFGIVALTMATRLSPWLRNPQNLDLSVPLWPIGLVVLVGVALYQVFQQGRHLWRRAWEAGQPGIRPPR